jgi:hypothetical protein
VVGTGINDFRNQLTYSTQSAKILTLDLVANFVNEQLDDVVTGICDVYTNVYTITLNKASAEGSVAQTIQLLGDVTYNGKSVTRTIIWTTSNPKIATVSSAGLVTLVKNGTCTITGTIDGNPVHADSAITVTATPALNSEIRITPDKNYVLEGDSETYTVYLYENDAQQGDSFTFSCNGNSVPSTSYAFTSVDGNHFTVANVLRNVSSYLTITCTTGATIRTYAVYLKGAW